MGSFSTFARVINVSGNTFMNLMGARERERGRERERERGGGGGGR